LKKNQISIFLSLISIFGIIIQNYRLAEMYLKVGGKTRALFGLREIIQLDVKLHLGIISIISLLFGILAFRREENKSFSVFSICLSGVSFTLLFIRFWKLMI
jgi:hypothetical protein